MEPDEELERLRRIHLATKQAVESDMQGIQTLLGTHPVRESALLLFDPPIQEHVQALSRVLLQRAPTQALRDVPWQRFCEAVLADTRVLAIVGAQAFACLAVARGEKILADWPDWERAEPESTYLRAYLEPFGLLLQASCQLSLKLPAQEPSGLQDEDHFAYWLHQCSPEQLVAVVRSCCNRIVETVQPDEQPASPQTSEFQDAVEPRRATLLSFVFLCRDCGLYEPPDDLPSIPTLSQLWASAGDP